MIDGAAFQVYSHWVKRGEGQNRAAMFEQLPKTDLKKGGKDVTLGQREAKKLQASFRVIYRSHTEHSLHD